MEVKKASEKLRNLSIFLAYNTNVDVIKHLDEDFVELFSEEEVEEAKTVDPEKLEGKVDLLGGIFEAMRKGTGDEVLINKDEFKNWLEENIQPEEKRMGGQTGIMSNLLSNLRCNTIVFTSTLSKEQTSLFEDTENLKFPIIENNELHLKHPKECWKDIATKKNWVFEFFEGQEIFGVTANSNSRFIASSKSKRDDLETRGIEEYVQELVDGLDCMILAGYHNLNEKYPDGSTWREHLESAKDFIREVKREKSDLKVQIEFAASHQKEIREAALEEVGPLADVLSFDLNELDFIMNDLEIEGGAPERNSPVEMYKVLKEIIKKLGIESVRIHTLNYFLSVSKNYVSPEIIKEGFEFARNLVWTKASGRNLTKENIEKAVDERPSKKGIRLRERLGEYFHDEEFKESGVRKGRFDTVMVPNKIYENPKLSVGLGDVISASSFALENALR